MSEKNGTVIGSDLHENLETLRRMCADSADVNIMNVRICGTDCAVVTAEGLVSAAALADLVFQPLMELKMCMDGDGIFRFLSSDSLLSTERVTVNSYGEMFRLLFSGFCLVLADGVSKCCAFGAQGFERRAVQTPDSEQTVRGAQDSFNEVVRCGMAMVRRRMKTPKLRFELVQCGKKTSTDVCIMYLSDRASPEAVAQVRKRIEGIELDTVLSGGYIEPFVDESYGSSFFSACSYTQRPDTACMRLNEGRICILADGAPFCLICPGLFADNFQTMDDMCTKPYYASFMRWLKYAAFLLAVALPGIYIALVMFHPEAFTLKLLLNLYVSEEATPFPLPVEMAILVILFEIMREAGIRLPKSIGGAVSIVGGLVVGDAAVKSGLISAPLLIAVGITATSAFVIPRLDQQISVLRLIFIFAGSLAGLLGIAAAAVLFTANVCAMDELSVSYLSPFSPLEAGGAADLLYRSSFAGYARRHTTVNENAQREETGD